MSATDFVGLRKSLGMLLVDPSGGDLLFFFFLCLAASGDRALAAGLAEEEGSMVRGVEDGGWDGDGTEGEGSGVPGSAAM